MTVPSQSTYDTFDLCQMYNKGYKIPCTHCENSCEKETTRTLRNDNPNYKSGACVSYVIPFCSRECHNAFIENCRASAPYQLGTDKEGGDVVFSFDENADLDGFWTMFSIIPEDGGWIIYQCTDEGECILDERYRLIWRLVEHSLFQKTVRAYN
jgi:hypothetical protein